MNLFDITRAGAVFNALEAARMAKARDARARGTHHTANAQPDPAATSRSRWRAWLGGLVR